MSTLAVEKQIADHLFPGAGKKMGPANELHTQPGRDPVNLVTSKGRVNKQPGIPAAFDRIEGMLLLYDFQKKLQSFMGIGQKMDMLILSKSGDNFHDPLCCLVGERP